MLSPKQVAQPNPSYPALCRPDTTSPRSTDYGGNIFCQTQIQMQEAAYMKKKGREKKKHIFRAKEKRENEKMKNMKNVEIKEKRPKGLPHRDVLRSETAETNPHRGPDHSEDHRHPTAAVY